MRKILTPICLTKTDPIQHPSSEVYSQLPSNHPLLWTAAQSLNYPPTMDKEDGILVNTHPRNNSHASQQCSETCLEHLQTLINIYSNSLAFTEKFEGPETILRLYPASLYLRKVSGRIAVSKIFASARTNNEINVLCSNGRIVSLESWCCNWKCEYRQKLYRAFWTVFN